MALLKIGPVTRTMRAQDILREMGIGSKKIKLTESADGCVHALEISEDEARRASSVLAANGIAAQPVVRKGTSGRI